MCRVKKAGIVVMNEIGLDPGIDHLYAVKTIDEVHAKGGKILSFLSYCGGLPAPEASNTPLGYKFSWSSRGVLLALRNSARYWQDGKVLMFAVIWLTLDFGDRWQRLDEHGTSLLYLPRFCFRRLSKS